MTLTSHDGPASHNLLTRGTIRRQPFLAVAALASALALSACSAQASPEASPDSGSSDLNAEQHDAESHEHDEGTEVEAAEPRLAVTYDGGIFVLNAKDGTVTSKIELNGFNRVSPAGDGRHILVSTAGGFQVLDAGAWSEPHGDHFHHLTANPALEDLKFPADKPGHVVRHAGKTVLFDDGTGTATVFNPTQLTSGALPETRTYKTPEPHHGVAVELENGQLIVTEGNEETRSGIKILNKPAADGSREVLQSSDECPGVHGEATAKDEAVVVGCENGLLVAKDGKISKIDSPDAYGRIGNQAGSDTSSVVLGDYKKDKKAQLERPKTFSLTDTATNELRLVETDYSYSSRSLGRGENGVALVFGTDGKLHIHDPASGKETGTVDVMDSWAEPVDWQLTRPSLYVQGGTAYVTEPSTKKIHVIDLASEKVTNTFDLPSEPNEITGITG